jgi:hypothetical protein
MPNIVIVVKEKILRVVQIMQVILLLAECSLFHTKSTKVQNIKLKIYCGCKNCKLEERKIEKGEKIITIQQINKLSNKLQICMAE